MSPIVFIVFAPVVVLGLALVSLLLGAATAGAWEAAEGRPERGSSAAETARPSVAPAGEVYGRAA